MLSGNSLRQTVYAHRASVHQAAKLVAVLLRVGRVTVGLAESYGSLLLGVWLMSPAGWLPRTGISFRTLCSVVRYGLPFCIKILLYIFCFWSSAADKADYFSAFERTLIILQCIMLILFFLVRVSSACRWHCKMLLGDVVHYGTWWHQSTTEQYIWYQCL